MSEKTTQVLEASRHIEKMVKVLEEKGFTVTKDGIVTNLYDFYFIRGNGIQASLCTKHRTEHRYASCDSLNGRIAMDHEDCFDKWKKCPVSLPIPTTDEELDYVIKELMYWGTEEGYEKSNNFDYIRLNDYPWNLQVKQSS